MLKKRGKKGLWILCGLVTAVVAVLVFYCLYQMSAYRWFPPTRHQEATWLAVVTTATSVKVIDTKDFTTIDVTAKDEKLRAVVDATVRSIESGGGYPAESLPRRWLVVYCSGEKKLAAQFNGKHIIIDGYHFHMGQPLYELITQRKHGPDKPFGPDVRAKRSVEPRLTVYLSMEAGLAPVAKRSHSAPTEDFKEAISAKAPRSSYRVTAS
jgi:hypothetical protein